MVTIMSLQIQKTKSSSFLSYQEGVLEESEQYSEIITFLERIRNFQLPDYFKSSSRSLSLYELRSEFSSLANNSN